MEPSTPLLSTAVPAAVATPVASQAKNTARNQLTQLVGKLVEDSGTQTSDLVTALNAIAAAINAKPAA